MVQRDWQNATRKQTFARWRNRRGNCPFNIPCLIVYLIYVDALISSCKLLPPSCVGRCRGSSAITDTGSVAHIKIGLRQQPVSRFRLEPSCLCLFNSIQIVYFNINNTTLYWKQRRIEFWKGGCLKHYLYNSSPPYLNIKNIHEKCINKKMWNRHNYIFIKQQ